MLILIHLFIGLVFLLNTVTIFVVLRMRRRRDGPKWIATEMRDVVRFKEVPVYRDREIIREVVREIPVVKEKTVIREVPKPYPVYMVSDEYMRSKFNERD